MKRTNALRRHQLSSFLEDTMQARDLWIGQTTRRGLIRAALAIAAVIGPTAAHAAACADFTDVDDTVVGALFCQNVEWIKNRGVTAGCSSATLYCPGDPVSRLAMAAFMNRLGNALTPVRLAIETTGAIDLDASPVVCQTADFTAVNFPRTAYADASLSGSASSDATFAADLAISIDAGATWTNLNTNPNRGSAPAGGWGNASDVGTRDLAVGQVARFGLRMTRGGVAGSAGLTDSRCQMRVLIYSRTGSTSPF